MNSRQHAPSVARLAPKLDRGGCVCRLLFICDVPTRKNQSADAKEIQTKWQGGGNSAQLPRPTPPPPARLWRIHIPLVFMYATIVFDVNYTAAVVKGWG